MPRNSATDHTDTPQKLPRWVELASWLPGRLTGGPFLMLFAFCGIAAEAILLARSPHPIFGETSSTVLFPIVVLAALVWIWVTLSWGLRGVAALSHALLNRLSGVTKWMAGIALILIGALGVLLYTFSWTLYLRTGQFANVESIQFGLQNVNVSWLWHYMLGSEGSFLVIFVLFASLQVVLIPVVILQARRTAWNSSVDITPSGRRTAWWALTLLVWLLCLSIMLDRSVLRMQGHAYELTNRLNPVVTFAVSSLQSLFDEPIEPCLQPSQLQRIETTRWQTPVNETERPSIIFVAVESLRHDVINQRHQGLELTPNLNRLTSNGLHLTRAYTQSTHSDYADVCIVSSLYPLRTRQHHFYRVTDPWPKTLIYDLLKPAGYSTAIISSQNEAWGGMDNFLRTPQLDFFYDAQASGIAEPVSALDVAMRNEVVAGALVGKHDDAHTATKAIEWITTQVQAGHPFFTGITFQNSHFPYPLPQEAERPFQPCDIDFPASFVEYPVEKTEVVRNAYFNSVRYCDLQIGRIVEALRELGELDKTILVVYGENGESFHENGQVTHANKPFEPSIRVASVIHAPSYLEAGEEDYPFELIDIVPTVFGIMGWSTHPNFQGTNVLSPQRPDLEQRKCFVHVQVALAHCDALIAGGRWKLHYFRDRGTFALFDLQNDPTESHDLAEEEKELCEQLQAELVDWRRQQLAYYHFPFYYEEYYPPHFQPAPSPSVESQ